MTQIGISYICVLNHIRNRVLSALCPWPQPSAPPILSCRMCCTGRGLPDCGQAGRAWPCGHRTLRPAGGGHGQPLAAGSQGLWAAGAWEKMGKMFTYTTWQVRRGKVDSYWTFGPGNTWNVSLILQVCSALYFYHTFFHKVMYSEVCRCKSYFTVLQEALQ